MTLVHPNNQKRVLRIELRDAVRIIAGNKNHWLGELNKVLDFENNDPTIPILNLDIVYQKLQFSLHLEEQLRAKLMSTNGTTKM